MSSINNELQQKIDYFLGDFYTISLSEMDSVELMNRLDTKYFFNINHLTQILRDALPYYRILEINNKRQFLYCTRYFDTPSFQLYHDHHNGRLNRYKIRQRRYDITGKEFFEIKYKNNKGQTLKKRIENTQPKTFNEKTINFLEEFTPFHADLLREVLENRFFRITLVNKNFTERATLDYGLEFLNTINNIQFSHLAILEIKQDFTTRYSPLKEIMHNLHNNPESISKYCTGVAYLYGQEVKLNAFKPKIYKLNKLQEIWK